MCGFFYAFSKNLNFWFLTEFVLMVHIYSIAGQHRPGRKAPLFKNLQQHKPHASTGDRRQTGERGKPANGANAHG
jgi:hypothetical protein